MDTGNSAPRWTAAAVWGFLALLLWVISRQMQGGDPQGNWIVRNSELMQMFAAHDAQKAAVNVSKAQSRNEPVRAAAADKSAVNAGVAAQKPVQEGKLDLNRASAAELDKLPGIGPSKAKAIVQYREQHGHFQTIEQLKNVKGIGDKTFENLKPSIMIGN